jgi:hypothetical protein
VIKKPTSQITYSPEKAAALVKSLRQAQDDQTARMGSDTVGVLAASDPDQRFFITAPFKNMRLVQHGNGNLVTNSLAYMSPEQNGTLEDRYYNPGTPVVLDKAGSGAGSSHLNLIRAGALPSGYYGADKVLVQKRFKLYPAGEAYPAIFVYAVAVRSEPRGYALQADERYDGGFYPGSINFGQERPYGTTFPTDDQGNYLYNGDPYSHAGWDGTTFTALYNAATKPVITSVVPNGFTLPDLRQPGEEIFIDFYGHNFSGCGFAMIGPFMPGFFYSGHLAADAFNGALPYVFVTDDTHLTINMPNDLVPGSYYPYVIGNDGQIGVAATPFVVDGPMPVPSGPGYDQDIDGNPV